MDTCDVWSDQIRAFRLSLSMQGLRLAAGAVGTCKICHAAWTPAPAVASTGRVRRSQERCRASGRRPLSAGIDRTKDDHRQLARKGRAASSSPRDNAGARFRASAWTD